MWSSPLTAIGVIWQGLDVELDYVIQIHTR